MRNALLRYRIMAYVVGTLLIVLVCVGVTLMMVRRLPGEYKEGNGALIFLCPILIAVLALHWLMLVLLVVVERRCWGLR